MIIHGTTGHVSAKSFLAIDVEYRTVIANHSKENASISGGGIVEEGFAKVGGDKLSASVRAVADHGGFIAIAIT